MLTVGSSPGRSRGVEEESHAPEGEYSHTPAPALPLGPFRGTHVGREHASMMGQSQLLLLAGHPAAEV